MFKFLYIFSSFIIIFCCCIKICHFHKYIPNKYNNNKHPILIFFSRTHTNTHKLKEVFRFFLVTYEVCHSIIVFCSCSLILLFFVVVLVFRDTHTHTCKKKKTTENRSVPTLFGKHARHSINVRVWHTKLTYWKWLIGLLLMQQGIFLVFYCFVPFLIHLL